MFRKAENRGMIIRLPLATGRARSAGRTADMSSDPVHYLSLAEVSRRLHRGELKPTALCEVIVARIAQHDGALKSYTTLLANRAMSKARLAEEEINRGF